MAQIKAGKDLQEHSFQRAGINVAGFLFPGSLWLFLSRRPLESCCLRSRVNIPHAPFTPEKVVGLLGP